MPNSDVPHYALLLNPDTVLPPNVLKRMLQFMDSARGWVHGVLSLVLADGSLDLACRRGFPTPEVSFYRMIGLSRLFPHHPVFGRYNLTFCNPDVEMEVTRWSVRSCWCAAKRSSRPTCWIASRRTT